MISKEEGLAAVRELAQNNLATKEEVENAFNSISGQTTAPVVGHKMSVSDVLYFVGALVVSMGAYFLVYNNEGLDAGTKIIFTLVFGLLNFGVGAFLNFKENLSSVSFAFFLVSAALIPFGLNIAFDAAGMNIAEPGAQTVISGLTFAFFFVANYFLKKNILLFFNIVFGTWFFFAVTDAILAGSPVFDWRFYAYRALIVGLSYILLGRFLSKNETTAPLQGFLYAFGLITFLGSAIALGGWKPDQNLFWELIFPVLVFGALYYSVAFRTQSFLVVGTLFLMGYIGKITGEYFSEGLGWPVALMICGILVIGAGYLFVFLRKKYSMT